MSDIQFKRREGEDQEYDILLNNLIKQETFKLYHRYHGIQYVSSSKMLKNIDSFQTNELQHIEVFQNMEVQLNETKFTDLHRAGVGCFGYVFVCKINNKRRAIKGIKVGYYDTQKQLFIKDYKQINKINNEYILSAQLKYSKNAIQSFKPFEVLPYAFIEMEECQMNLKQYMVQYGLLKENTIYKIVHDCINGIKDFHQKQIAVKDIKPDNILINYCFDFQISDLGLGEQITTKEQAQYVKDGNLLFMAPERKNLALNQNNESEQDTQFTIIGDNFSLGLIICYIIVGDKGFDEQNQKIMISDYKILLNKVFDRIKGFKYESQLNQIVTNLCQINTEQRWTSSEAFQKISEIQLLRDLKMLEYPTLKAEEEEIIQKSRFAEKLELITTFQEKNLIRLDDQIKKEYFQDQIDIKVKEFKEQNHFNSIDIQNGAGIGETNLNLNENSQFIQSIDQPQLPYNIFLRQSLIQPLPQQLSNQNKSHNQSKQKSSGQQSEQIQIQNQSEPNDGSQQHTININENQIQINTIDTQASNETTGQQSFVKYCNTILKGSGSELQYQDFNEIKLEEQTNCFAHILNLISLLICIAELGLTALYIILDKSIPHEIMLLTTVLQPFIQSLNWYYFYIQNQNELRKQLFALTFILFGFLSAPSIYKYLCLWRDFELEFFINYMSIATESIAFIVTLFIEVKLLQSDSVKFIISNKQIKSYFVPKEIKIKYTFLKGKNSII